ncbi:MAG TPA: YcxB family protein [Bacillus bacterium]|nr:YcxB family protein [Bacillus sp. (in: firmicutes)]
MENILNEELDSTIIRVELESKDFFWFTLHYLWKKMQQLILMGGLLFFLGIIILITQGPSIGLIIFFGPFFSFIFILLSTVYSGKQNAEKHGKRTYTINKNGLSFVSDEIQASYKWSTIVEVLKTKRYVYLFITPNSALIFPTRIFCEEQLTEFMGLITSVNKGKVKRKKSTQPKWQLVIFILFAFLVVVGVISFFSGK